MTPTLMTTTTTTTEVALAPRLRRKLLNELKVYAELRLQAKMVEEALDKHKKVIGGLREEAGVSTLSIDGYKVTQVTNLRSTLDKQKLIAMGVTTEMLEECTVVKPGRPYEKISVPGEKSYDPD